MRTCTVTGKPCHYTSCRTKGAACARKSPQPLNWHAQGEPKGAPVPAAPSRKKRK